jgi:predicted NAD/FAD-binding protein
VVGSGISGLSAAWTLARRHQVVLFEGDSRLGGHTHTVSLDLDGRRVDVDTGFIVFNERTYPNFLRLLAELDVPSRPTLMSFSVRCDRTGLEYSGSGLDGFFAQRRNLLRPRHLRMLRDVLRFQREAPDLLEQGDPGCTLGEYLDQRGYSRAFLEDHLLPMGGAIWSSTREQLRQFPAQAFVRFFHNHGLLQLRDRPRWRTIVGGSRRYIDAMLPRLADRVRLACRVRQVCRRPEGVWLETAAGRQGPFDHVVLATHSDQALRMLERPSALERELLGAIRFQTNEAVLHTDDRLLPRRPRARAAWNYHRTTGSERRPAVTYWMNALQSIDHPRPLCVTLNHTDAIAPRSILRRFEYDHPIFDRAALDAQQRRASISGADRVHYCGAYWRHGFHEDGVLSASWVMDEIERAARPVEARRQAG